MKRLLFDASYEDFFCKHPLHVLDIGARGQLQAPWRWITPDKQKILGFEPDPVEAQRLQQSSPSHYQYYPYAVWDSKKTIPFHLAKTESASSVYAVNQEVASKFDYKHYEGRELKKLLHVETTTIDSLYADGLLLDTDFIKLDTQGSEYEILAGAEEIIKEKTIGLVLETWTQEVHKGQKLTWEIMEYLDKLGFELFDCYVGGAWDRKVHLQKVGMGQSQVVVMDLLFFRKDVLTSLSFEKFLKGIAIIELWGFNTRAIQAVEEAIDKNHFNKKEELKQLLKILSNNWSRKGMRIKKDSPLVKLIQTYLGKFGYKITKLPSKGIPSLHES